MVSNPTHVGRRTFGVRGECSPQNSPRLTPPIAKFGQWIVNDGKSRFGHFLQS